MINDEYFKGKSVSIIGGTGSFGSTFVNHLKSSGVKSVKILSKMKRSSLILGEKLGI